MALVSSSVIIGDVSGTRKYVITRTTAGTVLMRKIAVSFWFGIFTTVLNILILKLQNCYKFLILKFPNGYNCLV